MAEAERREGFHALRRALHAAGLQLAVAKARIHPDDGPDQADAARALEKVRAALGRAEEAVANLETETAP